MVKFTSEYWLVTSKYSHSEGYKERRARRIAEREAMQAKGFKNNQYQFPLSQEKKARELAAQIKEKTGVELEVCKAFGMSF